MKTDRNSLFRSLEPPPGGSARMRAKLTAGRRSRSQPLIWAGPAAVAALVVLVVTAFIQQPEAPQPESLISDVALDRLLRRESDPLEFRVTRGTMPVAFSEIQGSDPKIRLINLQIAPAESEEQGSDPLL